MQEIELNQTTEYYLGEKEAVASSLKVDVQVGLSSEDVENRKNIFGENALQREKKVPLWQKIVEQFKDLMVIILIVAAIISAFTNDMIESLLIIAIVIINAILGVYQEGKAEQAVAALQKMSAPHARVLRDGAQLVIPAENLVPGDIVILEAGDIVPADCRLIESSNLKTQEAALTGESLPVEKDSTFFTEEKISLGDRRNMVFCSTAVTYGHGVALVVYIGENTEMGKIANQITQMKREQTPLQQNLNQLGKVLAIICFVIVVLTFLIGLLYGGEIIPLFMTAVSLAVAAVPEGLAAVITIVLALGMKRMARKNAIVKRLLAVETLGSVNIICSDKTGTLTQNAMTVSKIYYGDEAFNVTGQGYEPVGDITNEKGVPLYIDDVSKRFFEIAVLSNSAQLVQNETQEWDIIGDPTEGALLTMGAKANYQREALLNSYVKLGDLPFDSERKMMSVFHSGFKEGTVSLTKGAPDIILERCQKILTAQGVKTLTAEKRAEILAMNSKFARQALRVLSFAYKIIEKEDFSQAEDDMVFVGLAGMIDPARPEVKDAIAICNQAGIKAIMITGDYKETAMAIAQNLGLMQADDRVITGAELDEMSEAELKKVCNHVAVYARVSPEHKVRIVDALQAGGNIVSMTGDGVNDAPALKKADIGVAMGITGTEVSKSAADMILTDDNFSTIVTAVEEGRVIYSNIRKFVGFLLSCNVGEILVIFITMLAFGPHMIPLIPVQLLWLNLVTDSFPALALGREKGEKDNMSFPPRRKSDKIMDKNMKGSILIQALAIFIAVFMAYNIGLNRYGLRDTSEDDAQNPTVYHYVEGTKDVINQETGVILEAAEDYQAKKMGPSFGAMTYAFITLICAELLRAYSSRSERLSIFKIGFFSNKTMTKATILCVILTMAVIYIPALNHIFKTINLGFGDWAAILPCVVFPFICGELYKFFYGRKLGNRQKTTRI